MSCPPIREITQKKNSNILKFMDTATQGVYWGIFSGYEFKNGHQTSDHLPWFLFEESLIRQIVVGGIIGNNAPLIRVQKTKLYSTLFCVILDQPSYGLTLHVSRSSWYLLYFVKVFHVIDAQLKNIVNVWKGDILQSHHYGNIPCLSWKRPTGTSRYNHP